MTYKIRCIIAGVVIIVGIILSIIFIPKSNDYLENIIKERVKTIIQQQQETDKRINKRIDVLNKQIKQYNENIKQYDKKINELEGKIHENKVPATIEEMRNRFNSLGYKPIN